MTELDGAPGTAEHRGRRVEAEAVDRILDRLRLRGGHDFSGYKRSMVTRRVERRMRTLDIGVEEYLERLTGDAEESAHLVRDLLISLTRFPLADSMSHEGSGTVAGFADGAIEGIWAAGETGATGGGAEVRALRRELREMRDRLRSAVEQLEASNEELSTSNEELIASNEQLHDSKQELQAVNEELETVNDELSSRLVELARANGDLKNLFDNTHVATLFLDDDLCILRFTPAVRQIFHLRDSDVGRPLTDISPRLDYDALAADARAVLADGETLELLVDGADGTVYILRIGRYVTLGGAARGAVLTLVDVTERQRQRAELQRRAEQQEAVAKLGVTVLGAPDLAAVLEEAVATVHSTLDAGLVRVLELLPGGNELMLRAGVGWNGAASLSVPADPGSPAGLALASSEPLVSEDLGADPRFAASDLLVGQGAVSGVSAVIAGRQTAHGASSAPSAVTAALRPRRRPFPAGGGQRRRRCVGAPAGERRAGGEPA